MRPMGWAVAAAATVALAAGAPGAPGAEDDLVVVKRAVATAPARSAPEAPAPAPPSAAKEGHEPRWLKVRVTEKGEKQSRLSINLPLSLVRALGDGCPIRWHGTRLGKEGERPVRLSDVLRALESGQNIVEIEDEEATVRIWVE